MIYFFLLIVLNNAISNLNNENNVFDELRLSKPFDDVLLSLHHNPDKIYEEAALIKLLSSEREKYLLVKNNPELYKR